MTQRGRACTRAFHSRHVRGRERLRVHLRNLSLEGVPFREGSLIERQIINEAVNDRAYALARWLAGWIIQHEQILGHDRIFRPDLFSSAATSVREEKCKLERQVAKKEREEEESR